MKKGPLKRELDLDKCKKSYKQVAWFYDDWSRMTESKAAGRVIDLAEVEDGQRIIEIACGTGVLFEEIVKRNPNGQNVGLDLSPAMLDKARKRLQGFSKAHYSLVEGNVLALDLEDGSFDRLINNFMYDLMPEDTFDQISKEFYRLLKPGGQAVISVFSHGTAKIHGMWTWVAEHMPGLLTGCRPVDLERSLTGAGFTIETVEEISQNTFPSKVYGLRK